MKFTLVGFKQFVEDMDPTQDKQKAAALGHNDDSGDKEDYFAAFGDEFGVEWKDIAKIFAKEPWVSSHFPLGSPNKELQYKLAAWEIVPGSLSPNGADIRLKQSNRSYLKGNRLNKSTYEDKKRYHLSRKELITFLTTGWSPAVQQSQAQSMPGMDPSGGSLPPTAPSPPPI